MDQRSTCDALEILREVLPHDAEDERILEEERVNSQVARTLYDARTAAGLSQKDLAKRAGTTQSVISRIEDADYYGHSLKLLQRIAAALGQRVEVHFVPMPKK